LSAISQIKKYEENLFIEKYTYGMAVAVAVAVAL
jgi:hypothetical protein